MKMMKKKRIMKTMSHHLNAILMGVVRHDVKTSAGNSAFWGRVSHDSQAASRIQSLIEDSQDVLQSWSYKKIKQLNLSEHWRKTKPIPTPLPNETKCSLTIDRQHWIPLWRHWLLSQQQSSQKHILTVSLTRNQGHWPAMGYIVYNSGQNKSQKKI